MRTAHFDNRAVAIPQEAIDFVTHVLEASTEYAIVGIDLDGTIVFWNEGARRLYGSEPEEVIGKAHWSTLHTPEEVAAGRPAEVLEHALRDGKWEGTLAQFRKSRQHFRARLAATPRRDASGRAVGLLLFARDLSDETHRPYEPKPARFVTRSPLEANVDAVITTDPVGIITDVNQQVVGLTGYAREELIGTPFTDYFVDGECATAGVNETFQRGVVTDHVLTLARRDGEQLFVSLNASVVRDPLGGVRGIFASARDITERVRTEQRLESNARQQSCIAELGQRALAGTDPATLINEAPWAVAGALGAECAEILELHPDGSRMVRRAGVGWNPPDTIGNDGTLATPAGRALLSATPIVVSDLQGEHRFEIPAYLREHGMRSCLNVVIPGRDRPHGVLAAYTARPRTFGLSDVHFLSAIGEVLAIALERARAERRLSDALIRAEESDRLKTAFLANMSHEVRAPLNGILGFSTLIADAVQPEQTQVLAPLLDGMRCASARLLRTMHTVVDVSRLQTGAFRLSPAPVDVERVLDREVESARKLAATKGIELSCDVTAAGAVAVFDEYCLSHAVAHLLDNAVKFTTEGSVVARLERADAGGLRLSIRDTGLGIDEDYRPRVFAPFSRADASPTRHYEGAGLGLALVKGYVEMNGAAITFESEKNQGSTFTISFPPKLVVSTREDGATPDEPLRLEAPRRMSMRPVALLVEDDVDTQLYMQAILQDDFEAIVAANGDEARAQLASARDRVRVVLMDISLKGREDGLTLTRSLRADGQWRHLPIIATTAHAFPEDRAGALAAGCDAYLAKPIDRRDLLPLLHTMMSSPPSRRASP